MQGGSRDEILNIVWPQFYPGSFRCVEHIIQHTNTNPANPIASIFPFFNTLITSLLIFLHAIQSGCLKFDSSQDISKQESYIKISFKWTKGLNVRAKSTKLIQENRNKYV